MSSSDRPPAPGGGSAGWARTLRDSAPYLGLGTTLALTVLGGIGGGHWLDVRLGTRPVFLLVGGTLGVAAALYYFFKTVAGSSKRRTKDAT
jgi:F0F1-type ATP synthase assembly protein I